jgi:hypothetical protein
MSAMCRKQQEQEQEQEQEQQRVINMRPFLKKARFHDDESKNQVS